MGMDDDVTRIGEDDGDEGGSVLQPGEEFDGYRVIRLLGRGGMGEVYEVEHPVLGRRYALKLLSPQIAQSKGALERFQKEAGFSAQQDHPHIVKVDDYRHSGEHFWLRMELVTGGSLEEKMRAADGAMPEAEVRELLMQVLEGLKAAHGSGAVHRDLKPANILIDEDGCAKIADFGLVRLAGEQWVQSQVQQTVAKSMTMGSAPTEVGSSEGTSTKALLGTFAYMSPEQKRGEEADARSDLYAVGLMAFQMLTGEEQVGFDLPSDLVEGLDPAWDDWIRKAVAPQANRRFRDAGAMMASLPLVVAEKQMDEQRGEGAESSRLDDLEETAWERPTSEEDAAAGEKEDPVETKIEEEPEAVSSKPEKQKPAGNKGWLLFILIAVAVGGWVWWENSQKPVDRISDSSGYSSSTTAKTTNSSMSQNQSGPAEGSDREVGILETHPGAFAYWIQEDTRGVDNVFRAEWTYDEQIRNRRQITFQKASAPVSGYDVHVDKGLLALRIKFSSQRDSGRLYLAALDGSGVRQVSNIPVGPFAFSPGGDKVVFSRGDADQGDNNNLTYFFDIQTGRSELLLSAKEPHRDGRNSHKTSYCWLPDGRILFSNTKVWSDYAGEHDIHIYEDGRLNSISSNTDSGEQVVRLSPNNRKLLVRTMAYQRSGIAYIPWPEDNGQVTVTLRHPEAYIPYGWIDNNRILYYRNQALYAVNLDGTNTVNLSQKLGINGRHLRIIRAH